MKREFLKSLGLDDETIQKVLDEHGATVTANKKAAEEALNAVRAERDARGDIEPDALDTLKKQLEAAVEASKAYEGVDVNALNASLAEALSANESLQAKHAEQISSIAADLLLREKLATTAFSSDYARNGVFGDIKGKVAYEPGADGAIGTITGFDEALAELRESKPNAFAPEETQRQKATGKTHKAGGAEMDDFEKGFNS